MYNINVVTINETVICAGEELKKYLRMMMPEVGNFNIRFDSSAKSGIRIGLMQDFGLDVSDVSDTALDDIIYIDMKEKEGIIAGDTHVLFFLRFMSTLGRTDAVGFFLALTESIYPCVIPFP